MSLVAEILAVFVGAMLLLHLTTCAIVGFRLRRSGRLPTPANAEPVTLVRPVCGLEHGLEETLRSTFRLDYPACEILFCVAKESDPATPLIKRLMKENEETASRLLIGEARLNANGKLNNMAKGWREARTDLVVFVDSNVLLPEDYMQRILAAEGRGVGMVSAPPLAIGPDGFWATVECGFLNTWQARIQYAVDSTGFGFAQGKTLAFRRAVLERAGGMAALANEPAEDAAATQAIRRLGLRVTLADGPFPQPVGRRSAHAIWMRQVRWAKLRRETFPLLYTFEVCAGAILPAASASVAFAAFGLHPLLSALGVLSLWYGAEYALARMAGWPWGRGSLAACLMRDAMLLPIWFVGWRRSPAPWRSPTPSVAPAE